MHASHGEIFVFAFVFGTAFGMIVAYGAAIMDAWLVRKSIARAAARR